MDIAMQQKLISFYQISCSYEFHEQD